MKCPNCGGDSKGPVCDYCDTQLAEPPKPRPAAQTPVPPPVYPQPPATPPSSPPRRRLPHLLAAVVILAAAVSLVTGAFAYMAAPDSALIIEQGEASAASGGDDWTPSAEAETEETAAAETQEPRRGSRSHPIPLGETGEYNGLDSWLYNYRLELMVTSVKRGQEALDAVKAGSQFNDDPPEGKEYILVQFQVRALDSADDKKINLDNSLFRFVSAKGVTYNNFVAVLGLETPLTGLYSGGETEGTVYGLVDKDDSPLVVFLEGMDGSVWFSLK